MRRIFAVDRMVRPDAIMGELPSTREGYLKLVRIAIPSVIEMVFMSIIGSVDMVMLRGLPNPAAAIAAVGLAGQPRMLTLTMFFAINVGITAIVARRRGEQRREDANRALRNAIVMIFIISIAVVAVTLTFSRQLLMLAGAQADTIEMSNDYFRIMTYFAPISALTMCINAAQRGVGNTRTTMYVNLTSNLVNVVLDIFLIYGVQTKSGVQIIPAMGVAGDAWSSGIGLCAGFLLALFFINRNAYGESFLHLSLRDDWRLDKETVRSITKIGGNAMVEQVGVRIGFFAYAAIIARLGTQAVAAHQVGIQFLNLSFTFGDGLAAAAISLVGQMLGKKRPDLATIYAKCAQRLALCVSVVLASAIILFRGQLIRIFLDVSKPENLEAFTLALGVLVIVALVQPIQMSNVVISGCLRGAGDNLHVALVMVVCVVCIRPVLSVIAVYGLHLGLIGAWCTAFIDMTLRLILMYRRFRSGAWQLKKV